MLYSQILSKVDYLPSHHKLGGLKQQKFVLSQARMLWETVQSVKREKLPQYSCSLKPTEVREILYADPGLSKT